MAGAALSVENWESRWGQWLRAGAGVVEGHGALNFLIVNARGRSGDGAATIDFSGVHRCAGSLWQGRVDSGVLERHGA
jgi:hypothetical protein